MIKGDGSDTADCRRLDYIGRITATSKTDFDYGIVYAGSGKCKKTDCRHQLKFVNRLVPFCLKGGFFLHNSFITAYQVCITNVLPVDLYPFPKIDKIGGSK